MNYLLSLIAAIFSFGLAIYILIKDWRSFVHRIFALGMTLLAVEALISSLAFMADSGREILFWHRWRNYFIAFLPGVWLLFSLSFGRSNYQAYLRRWKGLVIIFFLLPLILLTIFSKNFFAGEPMQGAEGKWLLKINWAGYAFHLILLATAIIILMNMENVLRASSGRLRWQIKFIVFGVGGYWAFRIYDLSQILLFKSLDLDLLNINMGALIVTNLLILRALPRTEQFKIDFYLSSSFLYYSLTVLLVGVYLIIVGVLAQLFSAYNLIEAGREIPVKAFLIFLALIGLAALLFSDRVRKRTKIFISRHFQRPLYDYRKEWTNFTQETAAILEVKELCSKLAKMISRTLEALSVSIWLWDENKKTVELGGSTAFTGVNIENNRQIKEKISELMEVVQRRNVKNGFDPWANGNSVGVKVNGEILKELHINHFFPLVAGGKFLGLLTIGDRVGQEELRVEDLDLLHTLADQTAINISNLKLSRQLLELKEMEAFRTMSAFLMHDLKNLASSLSLTLQNLPIHFDNPEYRQDVLRVTEQNLAKINNLCAGLSALSQKIELKKVMTNVAELIVNSLKSLDIVPSADQEDGRKEDRQSEWKGNGQKISVICDLDDKMSLNIDPEQMQKVVINFLLNSRDALPNGGEIKIEARQNGNWAEISVTDNGCGISKDFIEKSLFYPFKTTKKKGMGIGLFQSKMIIEAHGGRIEVESEENVGTMFRIFLAMESE